MTNYQILKEQHRASRDQMNNDLSVRLHRSLSWLSRAEKELDDLDAGFIFYWISFNAAYAGKSLEDEVHTETSSYFEFFEKVVANDENNQIYNLIWERFSHEVRGILNNRFIFSSYWKESNSENNNYWETSFQQSIRKVNHALSNKDTVIILSILFSRIYVLRNQIFHGSATWNSSVNREQLSDCHKLLANLMPGLIQIMLDKPECDWGQLSYPVQ